MSDDRASGRPGKDRGDAALRGGDPAAPSAEEATRLAAPATSRPGDGRLQAASLQPPARPMTLTTENDLARRVTQGVADRVPTTAPTALMRPEQGLLAVSLRAEPVRARCCAPPRHRRRWIRATLFEGMASAALPKTPDGGAPEAFARGSRRRPARTSRRPRADGSGYRERRTSEADGCQIARCSCSRSRARPARKRGAVRCAVSRKPVRAMFGGRCQGMCPMCGVPVGPTMSL